jgi:cbb3-type cytochrome oxidase maturation protein
MSAVYIALPFALLLALLFLAGFIWSVRSGQMDDLDTPALRIFGEDDVRKPVADADSDETDDTM